MVGMKKLTLIISGMASSGKSTLAKNLAKKYGLKHYAGSDFLKELAIKKGYKPGGKGWWDTTEGMKFLTERQANPNFDKEVDGIMLQKAREGGVALTSWILPYLKDCPGIKIFVAVSQKVRAERMVKRDRIPYEKALEAVKERDEENKKLYLAHYGVDITKDLTPFDLVIDTDKLTAEQTFKEVAGFIEKKIKS